MNTEQVALNPSQIRYLVENGLVSPSKSKGGKGKKRQFTDHDLWIIELITKLRQAGFGIKTIKQSVLSDIGIQPYQNTGLLYTHDDKKNQFAAYWDRSRWEVETGLIGIIAMRKKADESTNCIYCYNEGNIEQAARIKALMEARDERSDP